MTCDHSIPKKKSPFRSLIASKGAQANILGAGIFSEICLLRFACFTHNKRL